MPEVVDWCWVGGRMMARPTQSEEDYLERIHELVEKKGCARVGELADSLRVRRASVTVMVQRLGEQGYLDYRPYRDLVLTDKGRAVACAVQRRHRVLARFLSLFGIDAETQRQDIEGMEHHLSPATVTLLADLADYFGTDPAAMMKFLGRRKEGEKGGGDGRWEGGKGEE